MAILLTVNCMASMRMGLVGYDEQVRAGDYMETVVVGQSIGESLTDITVAVAIPDLNIWSADSIGRLSRDSFLSKKFFFDIPKNTEPGIYVLKFSISDGDIRRVKYRTFEVI